MPQDETFHDFIELLKTVPQGNKIDMEDPATLMALSIIQRVGVEKIKEALARRLEKAALAEFYGHE